MTATTGDLPIARTAIHDWHLAHGAEMVERDGWLLVMGYGPIDSERVAAETAAAVIDLGPAGRFLVCGQPVEPLLYQAGWHPPLPLQSLAGTTAFLDQEPLDLRAARLAEDELLILCSQAERRVLREWLDRRISQRRGELAVVDLSSALAAMHLIGPQSREVLTRLTSLDVRESDFPPGRVVRCGLAGIAVTLIRSDWKGTGGFEIFCSRDYGEYLWTALLDAGGPVGIQPIGQAAYRTDVDLRFERTPNQLGTTKRFP